MSYTELSVEERATIQVGQYQGLSQREIARMLGRSPSTISRELRRNRSLNGRYVAHVAQAHTRERRKVCRPARKLVLGNERFELVLHLLRERFSPEQIAGKLRVMKINFEEAYVCRETIYKAIYAMPVGELRKELVQCLRQGKSTRRPRAGGVDRRGQIPDMVSIHLRPPEVEDRLMPGHWEGDLIKGKNNASAVGTLVERSSDYLMLVKMNDATSAVEGDSVALNGMPLAARKSMTYDQVKEMARHAELTQKAGIAVYFADPHSPWQRGTNENTNGLVRQFLPKGAELSKYTQEELDKFAYLLSIRPHKRFNWLCPIEVFTQLMGVQHQAPASIQ